MCQEASALHARGQARDASAIADRALKHCEEALGKAHYAWPLTLCAAAACSISLGDRTRTRILIAEAVEHAKKLQDDDFEHARSVLTHAAEIYGELGDHRMARQLWQDLIQGTGAELGEDHPRYFAALERLAAVPGDAQTPSKDRT